MIDFIVNRILGYIKKAMHNLFATRFFNKKMSASRAPKR